MTWKYIQTGGISYCNPLEGTGVWYWGMDDTHGDLYEAEELFLGKSVIESNRLIFLKYPEGTMYEPIKAEKGQYIGTPVYSEGEIFCPVVDFIDRKIRICKCSEEMERVSVIAEISLDEVKDCYNLMLEPMPLMLIRQGGEGDFQILWPDQADFAIDERESFVCREGNQLIFSRWYEDPDYREEMIIRAFPSGEIIKRMDGNVMLMPDGSKWILQ